MSNENKLIHLMNESLKFNCFWWTRWAAQFYGRFLERRHKVGKPVFGPTTRDDCLDYVETKLDGYSPQGLTFTF